MKWDDLREAIEGRWTRDHGTIPGRDGHLVRETLGMWIWRCVNASTSDCRDQPEIMRELCEASDDLADFLGRVRRDNRLRTRSVGWGEIAKVMGWGPLEAVGDGAEVYHAMSDAGGVLVGDPAGAFGIIVDNGYGDGQTLVVVTDRNQVNGDRFDFVTSLKGQCEVYDYDCAELGDGCAVAYLEGRYGVYSGDGCVVFERWGD